MRELVKKAFTEIERQQRTATLLKRVRRGEEIQQELMNAIEARDSLNAEYESRIMPILERLHQALSIVEAGLNARYELQLIDPNWSGLE